MYPGRSLTQGATPGEKAGPSAAGAVLRAGTGAAEQHLVLTTVCPHTTGAWASRSTDNPTNPVGRPVGDGGSGGGGGGGRGRAGIDWI